MRSRVQTVWRLDICSVFTVHRYLIDWLVCDAVSIENWIKQSQTAFTLINIKFFCIALTRARVHCTYAQAGRHCQLAFSNHNVTRFLSFLLFYPIVFLFSISHSYKRWFLCVSMNITHSDSANRRIDISHPFYCIAHVKSVLAALMWFSFFLYSYFFHWFQKFFGELWKRT